MKYVGKNQEHFVRFTVLETVLVKQLRHYLPGQTDPQKIVEHFFKSDADIRGVYCRLVKEGFDGADVLKLKDQILERLKNLAPQIH